MRAISWTWAQKVRTSSIGMRACDERAPQLIGYVGRSGLGGCLREPIDGRRDLLVLGTVEHADVERPGDPSVEPLLDRPHSPRAHHAEETGIHEQVHVVGDGALGTVDRPRHLGDRGGTLEDQLEEGGTQGVGQRSQLLVRGDHDHLLEVVVGDLPLIV